MRTNEETVGMLPCFGPKRAASPLQAPNRVLTNTGHTFSFGIASEGMSKRAPTRLMNWRFSSCIYLSAPLPNRTLKGLDRSVGTSTSFTSTAFFPIMRIFFSCLAFTAAYTSSIPFYTTWNTGSFANIGFSYALPYASTMDADPLALFAIVLAIIAGVGGGGRMFGISGPSIITLYFVSSAVGPLEGSSSRSQRRADA